MSIGEDGSNKPADGTYGLAMEARARKVINSILFKRGKKNPP